MNFEQMLLTRESCRAYQNKPVLRKDLIKICEAGRLTPSGCNSQPWKFMIVDESDSLSKICDALIVEGGHTGAPWREECPAFIVLVEQKAKLMKSVIDYYNDSQRFAQGDIAMASLNMCYQALELGLSTCILGMIDQEKMHKHFNIPKDQEIRLILAVGYSKEKNAPRHKARKAFEEIVCFNHWDG